MRLSLSYEMQRPVVDDHAVVEETIEQCVLADKRHVIPELKKQRRRAPAARRAARA